MDNALIKLEEHPDNFPWKLGVSLPDVDQISFFSEPAETHVERNVDKLVVLVLIQILNSHGIVV